MKLIPAIDLKYNKVVIPYGNRRSDYKEIPKDKSVLFKVIWKHPKLTDKDGNSKTTKKMLKASRTESEGRISYYYAKPYQLVSGDWQLEVRTLDDRLVYTNKFHINGVAN